MPHILIIRSELRGLDDEGISLRARHIHNYLHHKGRRIEPSIDFSKDIDETHLMRTFYRLDGAVLSHALYSIQGEPCISLRGIGFVDRRPVVMACLNDVASASGVPAHLWASFLGYEKNVRDSSYRLLESYLSQPL